MAARRLLDHVLQQRRLPNAGLAPQYDRTTLAPSDSLDQSAQYVALAPPALQLSGMSHKGFGGHLPDTNATPTPTGDECLLPYPRPQGHHWPPARFPRGCEHDPRNRHSSNDRQSKEPPCRTTSVPTVSRLLVNDGRLNLTDLFATPTAHTLESTPASVGSSRARLCSCRSLSRAHEYALDAGHFALDGKVPENVSSQEGEAYK